MSGKTENSKTKDKRLEEKEKLEAEAERSFAVARMKQAHKQIEDTEKSRKRATIVSICKRLDNHIDSIKVLVNLLVKSPNGTSIAPGTVYGDAVRNNIKTYESIRFDMKKTFEIKDEDFEKLFPNVEVRMENPYLAGSNLVSVIDQLKDMKIYCERLLH